MIRNAFIPCILLLWTHAPAFGEEQAALPDRAPGASHESWGLLEGYLVTAEAALMAENRPGHALASRRRVHLRLVERGAWFLDTSFQEDILYGFASDQVNHTFDYFRLGRALGPGALFLFWNHTCNNKIHDRGLNDAHWNDIGLGWASDPAPGAEHRGGIHYSLRTGWNFMMHNCDYRWMARADIHLRDSSAGGAGPFAELVLDVARDPERFTVCPVLEFGFAVPIAPSMLLEPFVRIERRRDVIRYGDDPDTWILAGLRLSLWAVPEPGEEARWDRTGKIRLEIDAGYAVRLLQKDIGYISDVSFRLLLPGLGSRWRAWAELHTGVNTPPENMFPNYFTVTAGPTLEWKPGPLNWGLHYRYRERRPIGHHWDGVPFKCLHAVTIEATPWKLAFEGKELDTLPERFSWTGAVTAYPFRNAFPYALDLAGRASVFLASWRGLLFFFEARTRLFLGPESRSLTGLASEVSMVLPGTAGNFYVFLRLEHSWDPFRLDEGDHYFLGFRLRY